LAREAYLAVYSGYGASSIAALIPAIEESLTRIVSDIAPHATAPEKIDHAINRAIQTAAQLHFEPLRVDRRLFRLSHAAMAGSSSMA
jgi:ribosomal protein S12 methylthiotransferase accessory factor YcaO